MSSENEIRDINVHVQRGPIDRRKRQLIITPDLLKIEDKGYADLITTFNKNEIFEYRYGINWIRGFEFTIGREYVIFIRKIKQLRSVLRPFMVGERKDIINFQTTS